MYTFIKIIMKIALQLRERESSVFVTLTPKYLELSAISKQYGFGIRLTFYINLTDYSFIVDKSVYLNLARSLLIKCIVS